VREHLLQLLAAVLVHGRGEHHGHGHRHAGGVCHVGHGVRRDDGTLPHGRGELAKWHGAWLHDHLIHLEERARDAQHVSIELALELLPFDVLGQRELLVEEHGAPGAHVHLASWASDHVLALDDDVAVLADNVDLAEWLRDRRVHGQRDVQAQHLGIGAQVWQELLDAKERHGVLQWDLNDEQMVEDVADHLLVFNVGRELEALLELAHEHAVHLLHLFLAVDGELAAVPLALDALKGRAEAADVDNDAVLLEALLHGRHSGGGAGGHGGETLGLVEPLDDWDGRGASVQGEQVELIESIKPQGSGEWRPCRWHGGGGHHGWHEPRAWEK